MKKRREPFWLLLVVLSAVPAKARVWTRDEQRFWEDRWRQCEHERAASSANAYHQVCLSEAMVAEVEKVQPGDTLQGWVGVVGAIEPVRDPVGEPCVAGTIRLSDEARPSPHRLEFRVPRAELTAELEHDLNAVRVGSLVTVTGVVAPAVEEVTDPTSNLTRFLDRTGGYFRVFWTRLVGKPSTPFAAFPHKKKTTPSSREVAVMKLSLMRVDPTWSLERRVLSTELDGLVAETARLRAEEEEVRSRVARLTVPAMACAVVQARAEDAGRSGDSAFQFALLDDVPGADAARFAVEWQGTKELKSIEQSVTVEKQRLSSERFYVRADAVSQWKKEVEEAAKRLRLAQQDLAVLERWVPDSPENGGGEEATIAAPSRPTSAEELEHVRYDGTGRIVTGTTATPAVGWAYEKGR